MWRRLVSFVFVLSLAALQVTARRGKPQQNATAPAYDDAGYRQP